MFEVVFLFLLNVINVFNLTQRREDIIPPGNAPRKNIKIKADESIEAVRCVLPEVQQSTLGGVSTSTTLALLSQTQDKAPRTVCVCTCTHVSVCTYT